MSGFSGATTPGLTKADVVNNLSSDDVTGEKAAGQHEVYELNTKVGNLIRKTNYKPTTDSDGDAFLTGLTITTGIVVGIYPIRNGSDGTYNATWFLMIGGDTNGTSFGFKAYKDNGTVLSNQKVNVDVYWIPAEYLAN